MRVKIVKNLLGFCHKSVNELINNGEKQGVNYEICY